MDVLLQRLRCPLQLLLLLSGIIVGEGSQTTQCPATAAAGGRGLVTLRYPEHCAVDDDDERGSCDWVVTSSDVDGASAFEIRLSARVTQANSYVSFGLSKDEKMGYDSVVDCIHDDETGLVSIQLSWNGRGIDNDPVPNRDSVLTGELCGSYVDGFITCRFRRLKHQRDSAAPDDRIFPLDSTVKYFILLARGPTMKGTKYYHNRRIQSEVAVNFSDVPRDVMAVEEPSKRLDHVRAHGILMVFAWMVFASVGMLMPRYCKPAWPERLWFGKKIWFQIHRACMILATILTAIGFIVVFAGVRRYSKLTAPTLVHPPLGIIVMILTVINPVMAMFRPEPDSKHRPIFNFSHFLVGFLAHVIAVITLFLAMYMVLPDLQQFVWCRAVMATFICFHAAIEIVLTIHMHWDKLSKICSIQKGQGTITQQQRSSTENEGSRFKTIVLVIHVVVVLAFAIAISVAIGQY